MNIEKLYFFSDCCDLCHSVQDSVCISLLPKIVVLKYSSYSLQESNLPWHDLGEGGFFGKASFSESQKGVSEELV